MLRLDLSPKFRVRREADRDPNPAADMVREARERTRRGERWRLILTAIAFGAATPYFVFKAQHFGHAPTNPPGPELVAKAPASPPAALAQKPPAQRLAKGVDFTATSATCLAAAKEGEEGFCGPTRAAAKPEIKAPEKAKAAKGSKNGKSAKTAKPTKSAETGAPKVKKAAGKNG